MRPRPLASLLVALAGAFPTALPAQHPPQHDDPSKPMYVATRSGESAEHVRALQLGPGLTADLVASEPDVANGVALAIDHQGRCWVAETFRINDGVFDTRNYLRWKDEDLACRTVADRVAKYERHFGKDLAGYAAFSERIRLLVDSNRDGTFDRSTVFAAGFDAPADGIASGVLPVGEAVYFTNIPALWLLRDQDGDGVADERTVLHDGYGVHTSLIGHDLHGLVLGPDRRLWFSIGDRGFRVVQRTPDGERVLDFPHEGAVLRCELDGSGLEVVHRGLRNPQELAFDDLGELLTGDNNSDGGDKARLVQIVFGADSGWRIGYQWLSDRGAWNRERLWHPRHPGQSAAILPPIANFADGPSGLAFDPGIGLPERFRGCFFLCDFRGSRSHSGVHAIRLEPDGAGLALASSERAVWNTLATDIDFGPDGSLYVLDWVSGWNKTGKGRIVRVRDAAPSNEFAARATATLLGGDWRRRGRAELRALLRHQDRRVRQSAQFALVDQGGDEELLAAAKDPSHRLARLHGVWGLGTRLRQRTGDAEPLANALIGLLGDGDSAVRTAAATMLGDARVAAAAEKLAGRLGDHHARVRREAALALARLPRDAAHTGALVLLLRQNDDHDAVLRHAGALALAAHADADELVRRCAEDTSAAVRLGCAIALSHQASPRLADLLVHRDLAVRQHAARAIHDTPVPAAMQALAKLCYDDAPDDVVVDWRAVQANRIVGEVENGEALVHFACLTNHDGAMRNEALEVLAEWTAPHGQCRVTGNWRPVEHPGAGIVVQNLTGSLPELLADPVTAATAARAAGRLKISGRTAELITLLHDAAMPTAARRAALDALADLEAPELAGALADLDASAPAALRRRAVELLSRTDPSRCVPILATLLENGTVAERQAAFVALGDLAHQDATALLGAWIDRLDAGGVEIAVQLDLVEAAERHESLRGRLAAQPTAGAAADETAFTMCLEGGDHDAGRRVFHEFEATRCTRCHALGGQGGNAGPALDGVGKRLDARALLVELVRPSARIAEGFATTTLELHDDSLRVGVITRDQDGSVTIVDQNGVASEVAWNRIRARRSNTDSGMPAMGGTLTKRQIRDLIAFLRRQ
jgi:quinoprotein glucose dehydrogenase